MASYVQLTLDTTAPSGLALSIGTGQVQTSATSQTLHISCSDEEKTGYQMKIWGDITGASAENEANWESYAAEKQVVLSSGDGLKTVYVKIRDDVYNESASVSATVTLNTAVPVVTITGPDVSRISKVSPKNVAVIGFMADVEFAEYTVRVVPSINSAHDAGTQIGELGGTGTFAASTSQSVSIYGDALETASSGDGQKIVKVFVRTSAGVWSV